MAGAAGGGSGELKRLFTSLGHQRRIELLAALAEGEGSATSLLPGFEGASVGDLSYHLRVLADTCNLIERTRSRRVRGATEIFFQLKPLYGVRDIWSQLPVAVRGPLRAAGLRRFVEGAAAAVASGVIERGPGVALAAWPVTLDREGLAEVHGALEEASERVARAEESSRARLRSRQGVGAIRAIVGTAAFELGADQGGIVDAG